MDIETLHMHVYYLNFLSYAFVELCLVFVDKCLVIFCGSNYFVDRTMSVKSYVSISSNYSVNG